MQRASRSSAAATVAPSPSSARPIFFRSAAAAASAGSSPMWAHVPHRRRASPPPAYPRRAPPAAAAAAGRLLLSDSDDEDRFSLSFDAEPAMPRRTRRRAAVRAESAMLASPPAASSASRKRKAASPAPAEAACESASKKPAARLKTDPSAPTEDINCCICMTEPEAKDLASIDGCGHQFCFGCIEKWADRENKCPLCKERFNKIERVMKPTKRSKGGPKSSVKVKNRDQRTDTQVALGHLFEDLLSSRGAFPQGHLARLLFSSIGAGPPPVFAALAAASASSSRRASQATRSRRTVPSFAPPPPRRTDSDAEGESTAASAARAIGTSASRASAAAARASRASAAAARASRASAAASSRIRMRLESHDSLFMDDDDSGDDSDSSGFGSFVAHMHRGGSGGISSMRFFEFGTTVRSPPVAPPPRSYATNSADRTAGRTADNALEIEDSDDDVEVVNLD